METQVLAYAVIGVNMTTEFKDVRGIGERANQLAAGICENSAECIGEQRHLNEGSRERAYWQYGYMVALRDVLRFLADNELPGREPGEPESHVLRRAA